MRRSWAPLAAACARRGAITQPTKETESCRLPLRSESAPRSDLVETSISEVKPIFALAMERQLSSDSGRSRGTVVDALTAQLRPPKDAVSYVFRSIYDVASSAPFAQISLKNSASLRIDRGCEHRFEVEEGHFSGGPGAALGQLLRGHDCGMVTHRS